MCFKSLPSEVQNNLQNMLVNGRNKVGQKYISAANELKELTGTKSQTSLNIPFCRFDLETIKRHWILKKQTSNIKSKTNKPN